MEKKKGGDEVVLVNEQKMLGVKDWQLPFGLCCDLQQLSEVAPTRKRKLQLATGRLASENRPSGHKQQTQPHEHTEAVDVPSLNNHLRMD